MTTSIGQHVGVANIAPIHPLVIPSLWLMLLKSFWVLDWKIIAVVVGANQTGSFVDGFAMATISKHRERGNLLHAYTSITSPLTYSHFSPSSATLPQRGCLIERSCLLNQRGCDQIWLHDDYTAFVHSYALHRHTSNCINSQPWHLTTKKPLPGPVHKKGILEALRAITA